MTETALMRQMRVVASEYGARLFRQQSGMAWTGSKVERVSAPRTMRLAAGDVVIRNARPFHSGFEGWSDLGGWVPVEITADMVGMTIAVYAQVEVKDGARVTEAQQRWIDAVIAAGGRAGVARSFDDLRSILFGATA